MFAFELIKEFSNISTDALVHVGALLALKRKTLLECVEGNFVFWNFGERLDFS
jgi:hypothetical protein